MLKIIFIQGGAQFASYFYGNLLIDMNDNT